GRDEQAEGGAEREHDPERDARSERQPADGRGEQPGAGDEREDDEDETGEQHDGNYAPSVKGAEGVRFFLVSGFWFAFRSTRTRGKPETRNQKKIGRPLPSTFYRPTLSSKSNFSLVDPTSVASVFEAMNSSMRSSFASACARSSVMNATPRRAR